MTQHSFSKKNNAGLTLVEMLIVVGVGTLLIGAITLFVGRGFTVNREQFEQVRITEDARKELETISNVIRNSRDLDLNNDGLWDQSNELWLQRANEYEFELYSNLDGDDGTERVRYFLEGTDLKREVTQPDANGQFGSPDEAVALIRSLRNEEQTKPLFSYFSVDGSPLTVPPALDYAERQTVVRIGFDLIIDVKTDQYPFEALVYTAVAPRRGQASSLEADLYITKSAPGTIMHNGVDMQVTYDVTVQNLGDGPASNVTVTDPIPQFLTLILGGSDPDCVQSGTDVVCTRAALAAGASTTFTLLFDVSPDADCARDIIVNDEVIATANEKDPDTSNNEAEDSSRVTCGPFSLWNDAIPIVYEFVRVGTVTANSETISIGEFNDGRVVTLFDEYSADIHASGPELDDYDSFVIGADSPGIIVYNEGGVTISQTDTVPMNETCWPAPGPNPTVESMLSDPDCQNKVRHCTVDGCVQGACPATPPPQGECVEYLPVLRYTFPAGSTVALERTQMFLNQIHFPGSFPP